MDPGDPVRETAGGILVSFKVIPRSRTDRLEGVHAGMVKLRITAPPVDNKANERIVDFLSRSFQVPRVSVRIIRGETSAKKSVFLPLTRQTFEARMAVLKTLKS